MFDQEGEGHNNCVRLQGNRETVQLNKSSFAKMAKVEERGNDNDIHSDFPLLLRMLKSVTKAKYCLFSQ